MTQTPTLRLPRRHAPLVHHAPARHVEPARVKRTHVERTEAGLAFGSYDMLFYAGLVAGIAAGVFALALGAWPWAASLVASPALIVAIGSVFDGDWVLLALFASPILILAGIVGSLVTARRATDRTWEL